MIGTREHTRMGIRPIKQLNSVIIFTSSTGRHAGRPLRYTVIC
jgi:hypothetical protein